LRRITKAALGGLAGCALALGGTQVASGVLSTIFREQSGDLLAAEGPFDMAKATVTITVEDVEGKNRSTTFKINLTKIDTSLDPSLLDPNQPPLGAHLHTGPCVPELGTSAGPHYNDEVVTENKVFPAPGEPPGRIAEVSANTEVWFNVKPDDPANPTVASDETTVPFVPVDPDGVMSIVVHQAFTNPTTGAAGPRQACFPLSVSNIFPTTVTK
jgi:Cu/Zn superoxide dismutase